MSIVASPTQQGVIPLPSAAHLQTNILNGTVRVASSTNPGVQNAVYTISGGPITSNVNLALPALSTDDTIATLNANNVWTTPHTFNQGFTSNGPINATSINSSGIVADSITSNGPMTASGNFNAANLQTPGTLGVGSGATITGAINSATTTNIGTTITTGNHTVTGTHTIKSTGSLVHNGNTLQVNPTNSGYSAGGGHLLLQNNTGGTDATFFGVQTGLTGGSSGGTVFATHQNQRLGFHGVGPTPTQPSHGNVLAPSTYTTGVQGLINDVYNFLRTKGFLA